MKNSLRHELGKDASVLAVLACAIFCALVWARGEEYTPYDYPAKVVTAYKTPETVVQHWPEHSRVAALALIAKYGEPKRFDDFSLAWSEYGPWSKTVVYRDAPRNIFGLRGKDVVEQSIWYDPPDSKLADLKRFDDRLAIDKSTGEMSSRSENEALNFLALNLADEIVNGKLTPADARVFYRKTVQFSEAGKSSPYMNGLLFTYQIPR